MKNVTMLKPQKNTWLNFFILTFRALSRNNSALAPWLAPADHGANFK